jgi:FAD/FMN-containing dehydrogenase
MSGTIDRRPFLRAAAGALGLGAAVATGARPARGKEIRPPPAGSGALDELRRSLTGPLLLPGDAGYDAASAPANGRFGDIRPIAVARCADERDVATCVRWSAQTGVPPVVRAGGHSYAGYSTTTGLLVDIRQLNGVRIDKRTGVAVTGGAALNRDLFDATVGSPYFLPGGTCLGVGVGGLVLGGGIGYNTHWAGLTCDHLRASRIVTATGELLDLDASTNSDLFWACRGGAGGSFGINTSFTFSLVEVPHRNISYYRYDWRGAAAAAAVFQIFGAIMQTAPPGLNAVALAQASEIGSGGPREAIDVVSRGQYIGPVHELHDLVRPLLTAGTPAKSTLEEIAFWDAQRIWVTDEPAPHSFDHISRYADAPLPDRAVNDVVELLASCPSRTATANGTMWSLGWVGGDVVNAIGRTDTAYVHRRMTTLVHPQAVWENDAPASVGEDMRAWTDR